MTRRTLLESIDERVFDALYSRSLVYNACWEDPAVDRLALDLGPADTLLVITSAGCNVLDYALTAPRRIHAVDANPRQSALLELKLAAIRNLAYDDFFRLFGEGAHPAARVIYHDALRPELDAFARDFWDERLHWFDPSGHGFYFRGLSGVVARAFHYYFRARPRLADDIAALFHCRSIDEQREIYDARVSRALWGPGLDWVLSRQLTLSLLGVPWPQRREVQAQHARGVPGFIRESIEYVVRQLPMATNYFYGLYLHGRYARSCCPAYLTPDGFTALKGGLVDRVRIHTATVTDFLRSTDERVTRFVLLDHMDWMSSYRPDALMEEWEAIFARATPDARLIFRSAHARPRYLESLRVGARELRLRERLTFRDGLAARLHRDDRVHTYAGFHIADMAA